MNRIGTLLIVVIIFFGNLFAQEEVDLGKEREAIKIALLNYAQRSSTGDVEKTGSAIHYDVVIANSTISELTGNPVFAYSTYSSIIENVRGVAPDEETQLPNVEIEVLTVEGIFANAKVVTKDTKEYFALVKADDNWKIINGITQAVTDEEDSPEESENIGNTVRNYVDGILG